MKFEIILSALVALVAVAACSSETCVEGASQACACTSGASGAQLCSGGKFGACVCSAPPADGGPRDAEPVDAHADDAGPLDDDAGPARDDAAPDASADALPRDAAPDSGPRDSGVPDFCSRFPAGYAEIAPGTFLMGSTDAQRPPGMFFINESPQHGVEIFRRFWFKETEVTQAEWEEVMGSGTNPSMHVGCPDCPVDRVSWHRAVDFVNRLSTRCGLPACYPAAEADREGFSVELDCTGFRLPIEAEWEYAARAGTTTDVYAGNVGRTSTSTVLDTIAWYAGNSRSMTHPVRQLAPNAWGLYDTAGNVAEWCSDGNREYDTAVPLRRDPMGPPSLSYKAVRGGGAFDAPIGTRAANRVAVSPAITIDPDQGFRVARTHP
jgi:formylglycine-generating enzyme required for sulfatase activity